jgi:hypothetical protein
MHGAEEETFFGLHALHTIISGRIAIPCIASIPERNTEAGMDKFGAMQMFVRVIEKGTSPRSQRNMEWVNPP